MARRFATGAILAALGACLVAWPAAAQKPLAEVEISPETIRWKPVERYPSVTLTVAGPDRDLERTFEGGEPAILEARSKEGSLADGLYSWELRANPKISPDARERLAAAREAQDRGMKVDLRELDLQPGRAPQTGFFTVSDGRFVATREKEPEPEAREKVTEIDGDLRVRGKKSFVAEDPATAGGRLVYVALEGPEAGTYLRGSAVTVDGVARIELPAHFAGVTESAGLTVQLTPAGGWSRLYVVEKSPALLVVREAAGRSGIAFDYLIQGVRRGYADHRVEQSYDGD